MAYAAIGAKLLALGLSHDPPQTLKAAADDAVSGARPDLLDRNGAILATDIKTMSVFAEPNRIIDIDEAVELVKTYSTDGSGSFVNGILSTIAAEVRPG